MISQFRKQITHEYSSNLATIIRWEKTLKFLTPIHDAKRGLDIGDRTEFTARLEDFFNVPFDNTEIDLDTGKLSGQYDIVTAFEVIEHLFNSLHLLEQIYNVLKPDGKLFFSTPLGKPHILWSSSHFHEMYKSSLCALFERARFEIIKDGQFRIHPIWFYFTGFRPLLRGIFEKTQIYELVPSYKI